MVENSKSLDYEELYRKASALLAKIDAIVSNTAETPAHRILDIRLLLDHADAVESGGAVQVNVGKLRERVGLGNQAVARYFQAKQEAGGIAYSVTSNSDGEKVRRESHLTFTPQFLETRTLETDVMRKQREEGLASVNNRVERLAEKKYHEKCPSCGNENLSVALVPVCESCGWQDETGMYTVLPAREVGRVEAPVEAPVEQAQPGREKPACERPRRQEVQEVPEEPDDIKFLQSLPPLEPDAPVIVPSAGTPVPVQAPRRARVPGGQDVTWAELDRVMPAHLVMGSPAWEKFVERVGYREALHVWKAARKEKRAELANRWG